MGTIKRSTVRAIAIITAVVILILYKFLDKYNLIPEWLSYVLIVISVILGFGEYIPFVKRFRHWIQNKFHLSKKTLNSDDTPKDPEVALFMKKSLCQHVLRKVNRQLELLELKHTEKHEQAFSLNLKYKIYNDVRGFTLDKPIDKGILNKFYEKRDKDLEDGPFRYILLGDSGSGKSYTLLKAIIERIENLSLERDPIPVYVNLSKWTGPFGETFEDLIISYMHKEYSENGEYDWMIHNHKVIIYLDEFDLIPSQNKSGHLEEILDYSSVHNVVLSCRKEEFHQTIEESDEKEKLLTKGEVFKLFVIDPLNPDEVKLFLKKNNPEKFNIYSRFSDVIKTPLLFGLFKNVIGNLTEKQIEGALALDNKNLTDFLWRQYEEMAYQRAEASKIMTRELIDYTRSQTASIVRLTKSHQFLIEQLQPSLLKTKFRIANYFWLSRIASGLLLAIGVGSVIATPLQFLGTGVIASVITIFLTLFFNKMPEGKVRPSTIVISFMGLVTIFTSIYQGLNSPRWEHDMIFTYHSVYLFSKTEVLSGLVFGLFFGAVFGVMKLKQSLDRDILPVEKFTFTGVGVLKRGLRAGLILGLFSAVIAFLIHTFLSDMSFYLWLKEYSEKISIGIDWYDWIDSSLRVTAILIMLGFVLGFSIGFVVFAIVDGLDRTQIALGDNKKGGYQFKLNSGIKTSFGYSFSSGFLSFLLMSIVFSFIFYFVNSENLEGIIRGTRIGFGIGIISFLGLGGFEVIKHWSLRLLLYMYGLFPLRLDKWLNNMSNLNLVNRVGASINLIDSSLAEFYISDDKYISNTYKKIKIKSLIAVFLLLFIFSAYSVYRPINDHFIHPKFWKEAGNFTINHPNDTTVLKVLDNHTIQVKKNGLYTLNIKGKVKLGTYLGKISCVGTELGFFGFPIGDKYDIVPRFSQGALMYVINLDTFEVGSGLISRPKPFLNDEVMDTLVLSQNEKVSFLLNDKEWENNTGKLTIGVMYCDTCKVNK